MPVLPSKTAGGAWRPNQSLYRSPASEPTKRAPCVPSKPTAKAQRAPRPTSPSLSPQQATRVARGPRPPAGPPPSSLKRPVEPSAPPQPSKPAAKPAAKPAKSGAPQPPREPPSKPKNSVYATILEGIDESASTLVAEGYPAFAPIVAHEASIQELLSDSSNILWDLAEDVFEDITLTHDTEWTLFPEVGQAARNQGFEYVALCIAICPSRAVWGVGLAGNVKKRTQAARLALCLALASTSKCTKAFTKHKGFQELCEMVGVELQAEKTVYEYVEKEQNSQDARDREEESREEESEWREEGWREEEWPQKEPPCKKFKGAQARGGPAQDENAPIPRDTPHWIFLDELPEHMEGYVQQGLVLATEGNTRKALYSTADDALGHVLVEDDVLFEDDADWTKFPEIAAALKTLGDREECITLAMSPSRAQWGIGVSMKGILCGLGGGIWVRCHAYTAGVLKRWRLRESQPTTAVGNQEPLLGESAPRRGCCACLKRCLVGMLGGRWRDLALVAAVTALNTVLASSLPLLGGKPQPLLISTIFDKTLLFSGHDTWVLPWAGVTGTICLCFLMKWTMTILALSSAIPAGVVAPTMIIGGLLGRVFGHVLLPDWLVEMLLTKEGQPPTGMQKGAFMARCAIVGASAFCAAVCRAFAMAITVFEVLALPNSVLPLCSSALAAIFVANKVSLPFFDANLATRNLGGIPAITFTDKAIEPVMKVMRVVDLSECLPQVVTLRHLLHVISTGDHDFFPIVRPLDWDTSNQGLLEGSMTRKQAERLLKTLDPHAATPDREIDLMNPEYQAPPDGGEPLVEGSPVRVSPDCTVKDVYLLMKVAESDGVVYVTDRGILQGTITLSTLMSREV